MPTTQQIATYLTANTATYQTDGVWQDAQVIADTLNTVSSSYPQPVTSVIASQIQEAIDSSELVAAVSAGINMSTGISFLNLLYNSSPIDLTKSNIISQIEMIFTPASVFPKTLAAIKKLAIRDGGLAEAQDGWGVGTMIDANQIGLALLEII
jgi:hypothetical protein